MKDSCLMKVESVAECSMLPLEHSAILLTCIKQWSVGLLFEWLLKTGFTVYTIPGIALYIPCSDPESFVWGDPTLKTFFYFFILLLFIFVDEGRENPNTTISRPSSAGGPMIAQHWMLTWSAIRAGIAWKNYHKLCDFSRMGETPA